MSWLQRGSSMRLGAAALRSDAGRCTLIVTFALIALVAGDCPRVANAEPSDAGRAVGSYDSEQRAEELYLDGVEKLAAGHAEFARETFQSLIARYPTSAAAAHARRELAALDQDSAARGFAEGGPQARAAAPPAMTGSIAAPALSDAPAPLALPATRSPAWDVELRRNASIQSKLRLEAGDRVFFSPGSAELGSRARSALAAQAQWLMRWHEFEAAIEGHADEPGTDQENVALSEQRAEAVRQRLIDEGVEPSRLAVVPLGRSVRLATCADTDCRAQNRRVVTLVFATGTRDRLGLVGSAPRAAALAPPASGTFAPATAIEGPAAAARQVGVAR
ncbi:OmpA family protein [Hyphomicrobium sp.]|uniref:OmpA family protein n=3 Tax=Hyphomicrobium sp. TaxID=82 RepID=UPI0025C3BA1C|nr:OmpA family protein [Hyphomicrobium sp.]